MTEIAPEIADLLREARWVLRNSTTTRVEGAKQRRQELLAAINGLCPEILPGIGKTEGGLSEMQTAVIARMAPGQRYSPTHLRAAMDLPTALYSDLVAELRDLVRRGVIRKDAPFYWREIVPLT